MLIIICKHVEIYTKTISSLWLGDYKPIFTEYSENFPLTLNTTIKDSTWSIQIICSQNDKSD